MNAELLALLVHDLKNQLGMLEAELAQLAAQTEPGRAHQAHQHCTQLRQRLIAYLTLYGAPRRELQALVENESPKDFLRSLTRIASRPDGAPLALGDCSAAPPFWHFDARLVRLALEAALHNAWRFASTEVLLGAREDEGQLVLVVDDNGSGLASPDPEAASSTGLGLELCAAVARSHQLNGRCGHVQLLERPSGGTRFEIWLP